jgi:hypothetical protein
MPPSVTPALGPDDLSELGYWLRERGIRVHPGQILTASRLLAGTHGSRPAAELALWLAPIFCSNAAEQERFPDLYADWLGQGASPDPEPKDGGGASVGTSQLPTIPFLHVWWPVVLLLFALLACGWMVWVVLAAPVPVPPSRIRPAGPAETVEVVTEAPLASTADFQPLDVFPVPSAVSPPVDGPAKLPGNGAPRAAGGLALIAALAWWLYVAARRRGFLERLPADDSDTRNRLASSPVPALAAYGSELRYLSREMRRRRSVPSRRFDVRQTIGTTIRAGGLPHPVFGSLGEPGYLVLVEQASESDHQSELADEVMRLMLGGGVAVDRYTFDGDPRFCRHAPLTERPLYAGPQNLEALYARHPDARLIVFSDGNGMIDPATGQPAACVRSLLEWPEPLLVTPQPARLWAQREWVLAQTGLALLPLDAAGLRTLGQMLHQPTAWQGVDPAARGRKRPAYLRDVDVLLDRRTPGAEVLGDVLGALERDLGPEATAWLAACAVYPDIRWGITLALGDCIARQASSTEARPLRDDGYAQQLAQLARLPWMRMGYMPDWLRTALLARLPPTTEAAIRSALNDFLASVRQNDAARRGALEIAVPSLQHRWRDVLAGMRAWCRLTPRTETREDAIFLHFMDGLRRPLAVDANRRLVQLLYKHGLPLGGPRAWLPLAACALAAAMFQVPPTTRPSPETAPVLPAPVVLAFDDTGERLAVVTDAGGIVVRQLPTPQKALGRNMCSTGAPMPVPLGIGMGASADYVYQTAEGIMRTRLGADCTVPEALLPPAIAAIAADPSGRLSIRSGDSADVGDALCSSGAAGRLTIATRAVVDAALPADARPGVACALADDGSALLVASQSADLFEYPLDGGETVFVRVGKLPSRTGSGKTLAISGVHGIIAVVTADGQLWVTQAGMSFESINVTAARPPLAISNGGQTIAFANAQREVVVWRMQPVVDAPIADTFGGESAGGPAAASLSASQVAAAAPDATARRRGDMVQNGGRGSNTDISVGPAIESVASAGIPDTSPAEPSKLNVDETIEFSNESQIPPAGAQKLDGIVAQLQGAEFYEISLLGKVPAKKMTREGDKAPGRRLTELVRGYLVEHGIREDRVYASTGPGLESRNPFTQQRRAVLVHVEARGIRRGEPTEAPPPGQQVQALQRNLQAERILPPPPAASK